jgi:Na+/proline symporter
MKKIFKIIGFGIVIWLIPFIASFFLYSRTGTPMVNVFLVKTIMIVLGAFAGVLLLVIYFKGIEKNHLREGIMVGFTWLIINWLLDFVILLPIAKVNMTIYFSQTGLRYLMIPIISIGMGYILDAKTSKKITL